MYSLIHKQHCFLKHEVIAKPVLGSVTRAVSVLNDFKNDLISSLVYNFTKLTEFVNAIKT